MALRDLDIDVDVEVDASELRKANEQVDELVRKMRELDRVYRIKLEINDTEIASQIRTIETQMQQLSANPYRIDIKLDDITSDVAQIHAQLQLIQRHTIDVDVDTAGAMAQIAVLQAQLATLRAGTRINIGGANSNSSGPIGSSGRNSGPTIDVNQQARETIAELGRLQQSINQLNREDIFFDVDVRNAQSELLGLRAQIRMLERDVNLNIDTTAAHLQLAGVQAHIRVLQAASSGLGNMSSIGARLRGSGTIVGELATNVGKGLSSFGMMTKVGMIGGVTAALPLLASAAQVATGTIGTLGVAVGVLGGGIGALASSVGVAAIGLGGFAALGITTIVGLYDENAKLTASQKELKKETDSVIATWGKLKKTLEPYTFGAITSGVGVVNNLLERSEPILERATIAVDGLFDSFDKVLDSERGIGIFDYLERSVGPLTTNIGNGLGYALQGVFNWMVALEPLTNWVGQGFENMMQDFADWTNGLQGSDRMTAFMDYVMENMPKIGKIIGDTTDGVVGFFEAFDVTASDGLNWMSGKMEDFAKWSAGLDENEGFQDMLDRIKTDGPVIAEITGDIAKGVMDITTALSNFGRGENGENGFLNFLADSREFSDNIINFAPPAKVVNWAGNKMFGGEETPKVEVEVGADTTKYTQQVNDLSTTTPTIKIPAFPSVIDPMTFRAGFNGGTEPITLPITAQVDKIAVTETPPTIKAAAQISSVDMTQVGPLKMPAINEMNSPLNNFTWPPFPEFKWPPWLALPKFEWPPMPRFSWPPIPTVSVNVNVTGGGVSQSQSSIFPNIPRLPGFSSGLGRVEADEMPVNVHRDEAIIHATGADVLRDEGILRGDGRNPIVDTSHLAAHNTTNQSSSKSVQVDVGGISIVIQGGNTNEETGRSVRETVESIFGDLGFAMFQPREG